MSSDYGYINARVKAMKSRLLSRERLYELLAARDLTAFADTLGSTDFGKDLGEAFSRAPRPALGLSGTPGPLGLSAVEEGLRRNLCRTSAKLLSFADGRAGELLGVIVERWDLENIKAVLRGKHTRLSKPDILSGVVPAGRLDEARISELAEAEDAKAVADMLATWRSPFARPLTKALSAYAEDNSLANLELALDRFYVSAGLETVKKGDRNAVLIRGILKEQVDVLNLGTALRLRGEALEESPLLSYWVPGGEKILERHFLALARAESFTQALALTPPSLHLLEKPGGPESPRAGRGDEADFERALSRAFALRCARLYRGDPLAINIPVGYLGMKTLEVANLRLIARGKAFGLSRPELEAELLLV
jgi:V/A-type H+-transporting ATPase subunit C